MGDRQRITPALRSAWNTLPLVLVVAGGFSSTTAHAQTLRGSVVADSNGRRIEHAHVTVLHGSEDAVIASRISPDGNFVFDLPEPGEYRLRVEALSYRSMTSAPLQISASTVLTIELRLHPEAIVLEPLRIVGARPEPPFMRDVRSRHHFSSGRLITREQLDERSGSRLQDVLRDAGLRITEVGPLRIPLVSGRVLSTLSRDCYADLYLNGIRQYSFDKPDLSNVWELFH